MFFLDGTRFSLIGGKYTEIWSIETGGILSIIEHKTRVTCAEWSTDSELVVGYEDGHIVTVNTTDETIEKNVKVHSSRVKAIALYENKFLVSGASDGEIKIYSLEDMTEEAIFDSGCRITCIAVSEMKVKKEEEDSDCEIEEEVK